MENIEMQPEPRFRGYSMNTLNRDAAPGYCVNLRKWCVLRKSLWKDQLRGSFYPVGVVSFLEVEYHVVG